MSDSVIDPRFLEIFPTWLNTLGKDAAAVGEAIAVHSQDEAHGDIGRYLTAGLNYIFKSLDLIPDGIDDLGFLDDAFVLRIAAQLATAEQPDAREGAIGRLAGEADAVKDFLGADYVRLETYVRALRKGAARGRTVEDIMTDADTRTTFLQEVGAWGEHYQVPSFTRDMKTLIKLRAFLSAKLA